MTIFIRSFLTLAVVALLSAFLTGCDLIGDAWNALWGMDSNITKPFYKSQASVFTVEMEEEICNAPLPQNEAQQLAQDYLGQNEAAQTLQSFLSGQGNSVDVNSAIGCQLDSLPEGVSGTSGGSEEDPIEFGDPTLIEIPAGENAAMYFVKDPLFTDGNSWATVTETVEEGERLTHIEFGINDGDDLSAGSATVVEQSLFLPDSIATQEVVSDLQSKIQAGETGFEVIDSGNLDWANAEIILDENTLLLALDGAEEFEALIAVPQIVPTTPSELSDLLPEQFGFTDDDTQYINVVVRKHQPVTDTRSTFSVKVSPPKVDVSNNLPDLYSSCPHQYRENLSKFQKAMCQNYWNKGHKKTFRTGNIINQALDLYNVEITKGDYGVVYARDKNRDLAVALAGYENLTKGEVENFLDVAENLNLPNVNDFISLDEMVAAIEPCMFDAVESLTHNFTENNLNGWRAECVYFERFYSALEYGADEGLLSRSAPEMLVLILEAVCQEHQAPDVIPQSFFDLNQEPTNDNDLRLKRIAFLTYGPLDAIGNFLGGIGGFFDAWSVRGDVIDLLAKLTQEVLDRDVINEGSVPPLLPEAMAFFLTTQGIHLVNAIMFCTECNKRTVMEHYLQRLKDVENHIGANGFPNAVRGLMSELSLTFTLTSTNAADWELVDFSLPMGETQNDGEVDIVVVKHIEGIGRVAAFVENKGGIINLDTLNTNQIERYIDFTLKKQADCILRGDCLVRADLYVVVLVFHHETPLHVARTAATYAQNKLVPVVVIYCVANCGSAIAEYRQTSNFNIDNNTAQGICEGMKLCGEQAIVQDEPEDDFSAVVIHPADSVNQANFCSGIVCLSS